MKTLQINKIIKELESLGFNINPDFLTDDQMDAPILEQVDLLLGAIPEKGLKLTQKGNLPTKVVKEIALCCPSGSEGRFLKYTKRYLEEEQVSVGRARVVCEAGKLVKIVKGKMLPGSMAEAYRAAGSAEKYLYLLWFYGKVNLGYFDRMQETELIDSLAFLLLQIIRDKQVMFRSVDAYSAFLIDTFPDIAERVEEEIEPDSYFSEDSFDEFERMLKIRLCKNYYLPFGLIEEQGWEYGEAYECCKADLLGRLLLPHDAVDTTVILNKKQFHLLAQRIKKERLDIDLFYDYCFIYAGCAQYPLEPTELIVEELMKHARVIGTVAAAKKQFYYEFIDAIRQTLKYFTQLEVKGGGSAGESMKAEFISMVDGLYLLLPKDKPFNMINAIQSIPLFFLNMLATVHQIDAGPDFYAQCEKRFDKETAEDIGAVIFLMGELRKKSKKFKRINANLESMVKEAIMAFVIAVMSIHTYQLDHGR